MALHGTIVRTVPWYHQIETRRYAAGQIFSNSRDEARKKRPEIHFWAGTGVSNNPTLLEILAVPGVPDAWSRDWALHQKQTGKPRPP